VMLQSGPELQFRPEPLRTGQRTGPKFGAEPNPNLTLAALHCNVCGSLSSSHAVSPSHTLMLSHTLTPHAGRTFALSVGYILALSQVAPHPHAVMQIRRFTVFHPCAVSLSRTITPSRTFALHAGCTFVKVFHFCCWQYHQCPKVAHTTHHANPSPPTYLCPHVQHLKFAPALTRLTPTPTSTLIRGPLWQHVDFALALSR